MFKPEPTPGSDDLRRFADSRPDIRVVLGQNQPVRLDGRTQYPDVVVYKGDDLLAVVQVKAYITNGREEVAHELDILDALQAKHDQMQAVLVVYSTLPSGRRAKIRPELMSAQEESNGRFHFLSLEDSDDNEKMADVLTQTLGLERLRPRSGGA